jgi:myo-inositol-1(or 4)-monophosphatase
LGTQSEPWFKPLAVATRAAIEAGDYFRSRIDSVREVKTKSSPSDLVTDVDPECERRIRQHIAEAFPEHEVLGEETTEPGSAASAKATAKAANAQHLWIVDPLDGTTNFVQGLPLSVVSIAYAEAGKLCVGVVYDPYRQEVFYAVRGIGAYRVSAYEASDFANGQSTSLPGEKLQVANEKELRACVVATGVPTRGEARAWTTEAALNLVGKVKSFRALGAAALQLAYVAAGRLDAFWEYDLNAWDLAAGVLLIQEAGGIVREIGGKPYHLGVRNVVAAGRDDVVEDIDAAVQIPDALRG